MNHKRTCIVILVIACIASASVLTIIGLSMLPQGEKNVENNQLEKQFIGKWLLESTIDKIENETTDNNIGNEYDIEFFTNGTCKQLNDFETDSWIWDNWTIRDDYIVFGENPLPSNGDAFIRIYYNFSENNNRLSLYHAHLMVTKNYIKI